MTRTRTLFAALVLSPSLTSPDSLGAQVGACRVYVDSTLGVGRQVTVPGGQHYYGNGGVFTRCLGENIYMSADSVAAFTERQRMDLVRNVRFEDPSIDLVADRATYHLADQRLEATGNVVLSNRLTGSQMQAPNLTYLRAATGVRETAEIFARSRPIVVYRTSLAESDPYLIEADRIHMLGGSQAWAGGAVTINRQAFHAAADSMEMNTGSEAGELIRNASIVTGAPSDSSAYTLTGITIAYRTTGGEIDWVQARDSASAVGDTWELHGDTIEFQMTDGKVQGAIAWGRGTRTAATAGYYRISADSLEVDMPEQTLREIRGYLNAVAQSQADSLADPDWIAGDTVTAMFGGEGGVAGLEQLIAIGSARAFYRIYTQFSPVPGINYARGDLILARFGADALEDVRVVGNADGVYLEPIQPGLEPVPQVRDSTEQGRP